MNIEYISVWVVEIDLISVSVVFVRVDEKVLVFVSGHRDWLDITVGIDINLIWVLAAELVKFCVGDRK